MYEVFTERRAGEHDGRVFTAWWEQTGTRGCGEDWIREGGDGHHWGSLEHCEESARRPEPPFSLRPQGRS